MDQKPFLTDIKTLRQRAREHRERGYKAGRVVVVKRLLEETGGR